MKYNFKEAGQYDALDLSKYATKKVSWIYKDLDNGTYTFVENIDPFHTIPFRAAILVNITDNGISSIPINKPVSKVYIMANAQNLFTSSNNQYLGKIILNFEHGNNIEKQLIAGQNIRNFKTFTEPTIFGQEFHAIEHTNDMTVWHAMTKERGIDCSQDNQFCTTYYPPEHEFMDVITMVIPPELQQSKLQNIVINGTSSCFCTVFVSAITLQNYNFDTKDQFFTIFLILTIVSSISLSIARLLTNKQRPKYFPDIVILSVIVVLFTGYDLLYGFGAYIGPILVLGLTYGTLTIVSKCSLKIAKMLFGVQRYSILHLVKGKLLENDDFLILPIHNKPILSYVFLIFAWCAVSITIAKTLVVTDIVHLNNILIPNFSEGYQDFFISMVFSPIIALIVFPISILESSNLRVYLKKKSVVTTSATPFRYLLGVIGSIGTIFVILPNLRPIELSIIGLIFAAPFYLIGLLYFYRYQNPFSVKFRQFLKDMGIQEKELDFH